MMEENVINGICCDVENCVYNNGSCCCTAHEIHVNHRATTAQKQCAKPSAKYNHSFPAAAGLRLRAWQCLLNACNARP